MRVQLRLVCSRRIKNSYRGLGGGVASPLLPRRMRKPASRTKCTERHQPTVTAVNYARRRAAMLQGCFFLFFLSCGLRVVSPCQGKKTARNYENHSATVFWEMKNPELSKPCLLILRPSASASPPYVPPYFHHFCSVQASPGVSSGTPLRLRPLLRCTSSLWLQSGSAARPGASCSPPGQLGCLMVPFTRPVVEVGEGCRPCCRLYCERY